ncbi:MAG: hypothetical protein ACWA5P_06740 [bacterium]
MSELYQKLNLDWHQNFLGYSALAVILSTGIGSIAIMAALVNGNGILEMILVTLVVAACSAHNASIISVQKPSVVLKLLIISIVISLMVAGISMLYA